MAKSNLTDLEVEQEIARLRSSEAFKVAEKYQKYQYRRRQYMYGLRCQVKKGLELMRQGYTLENIEQKLREEDEVY